MALYVNLGLFSLLLAIIIIYRVFGKRKLYFELVIVYFISLFINYNVLIKNLNILSLEDRVVVILFSMMAAYLYNFIFVLIFQKVVENRIISKYKKDFNIDNYEYYRELLSNISPAILAYCYNTNINIEDIIVAIILNLHLNGKLEINSEKIKLLVDYKELSIHERTAVLFNKFYKPFEFKKKFKNLLIDDMLKDGYLEKRSISEFDVTYFMDLVFITMLIFSIITYNYIVNTSLIFLLRGIIVGFFISCIYIIIKLVTRDTVMSKIGIELSSKLRGIKKFLVDFSNINDRGIGDIKIYEEYIIYAIIFNIKGNLNDECNEIYKGIRNLTIKGKSKW